MLTVTAHDPGRQEHDVDGAVYTIAIVDGRVHVRVWNTFECPSPTWSGHIQPILQQYANLYPVMDAFVRLGAIVLLLGAAGDGIPNGARRDQR